MVTLIDRRDYWEAHNIGSIMLEQTDTGVMVPIGQPVTQADLEAIPAADIETWLTLRAKEGTRELLIQAVQHHLDTAAQAKGYDNIFTACTYDGDIDITFDSEGKAFKNWRSEVWGYTINVKAEVEAGTRVTPTPEALVAELPLLVL